MRSLPHASSLRLGRHSEPGRIYLITTVTQDRRPVFRDLTAARVLVRALMREQAENRASTLAYVVMPDHLHWLMQLGDDRPLPGVVRAIKAVTAHRLGHALWQKGFHDHALRRDEDMVAMARYIVANPLRAGLAQRLGDYPHWDAVWV